MAATSPKPEAITVDIPETTNANVNSTEKVDPSNSTQQDNSDGKIKDLGSTSTQADFDDASGRQFDVIDKYRPLYDAILKGDWRSAKMFLKEHPDGLTAGISFPYMSTALIVAAMEGHSSIVDKLVQAMPVETIALADESGYPALLFALVDGNIKSVTAILKKDPSLAYSMDSSGRTPLATTLIHSNGQAELPNKNKPKSKKAIWLLSAIMRDEQSVGFPFTGAQAHNLYYFLINIGYFDICLFLLERYPVFIADKERIDNLLYALAQCPSHFPSGSRLGFWERCIYSFVPVHLRNTPQHWLKEEIQKIIPNSMHLFGTRPRASRVFHVAYWTRRMLWRILAYFVPNLKYIRYEKKKHVYAIKLTNYLFTQLSHKCYVECTSPTVSASLFRATINGVIEIIKAFYHHFPDMLWRWRPFVPQYAIEYRQDQIFSLFNGINGRNKRLLSRVNKGDLNAYRLAAKLSPSPKLSSVAGSAFQIQRELQWFKEVEKFIVPHERNWKRDNKTAWEEFMEEHKDLQEKAEQWMKDTSNYCMVVAALIAAVVFAAAFTAPGGNDDNGDPIFIMENSFMVFSTFNALALFSSIISILIFLSILTSSSAMEDFLVALPKRVILGLVFLFLAIATMLIAFGAALSIVLNERWKWASIPITLLSLVPVIMFAILQLPLFIEMIQSTFRYGVFRSQKIW